MRLRRRLRQRAPPRQRAEPQRRWRCSGASTATATADHRRARRRTSGSSRRSMTRTVNCLEEGGYVVRRPHETDGRQVVVEPDRPGPRTRAAPTARRRDAWLAQRLRELTPDERDVLRQAAPILEDSPSRTDHQLEPHVPRPRNPNYRLYAAGSLVSNTGTWMQRVAQDWLVLQLTGTGGTALGITTGLQFLPFLLLSPVRRPARRPVPEAPAARRSPSRMAVPALVLGVLAVHRRRADLARLRARAPLRHRLGLRRPRPPVVRGRDGRPRRR